MTKPFARFPAIAACAVAALLWAAVPADADPSTDAAGASASGDATGSPPAPAVEAKPAPAEIKAGVKNDLPPPNLETLASGSAVAILGKKVRGASGENMGLVVDVLVGSDGAPRAAVIDFGGFIGVGSRKIGVAWPLLHFKPEDRDAPVLLELNRAQLQAAPEYKETAGSSQIMGPPPAAGSTPPADGG